MSSSASESTDFTKVTFNNLKYQYLAVLCANIIALSHGSAIGWLSPALPFLQSDESPLKTGKINLEETSWIGSYFSIGSIIGNCIFGVLISICGRKKAMCLLALPNFTFWLFVIFSREVYHLYIGRILAGISGGGMYVCIPLFVAEISHPSIRGALGSLLMVICCLGILLGYIAGAFLSYFVVPYVFIGLPVLYFCGFICFPDSPHNLLTNNNIDAAEKSLRFYNNLHSTTKEGNAFISSELENLQIMIKAREEEKLNRNVFQFLYTAPAIKGILIGFCLTALNLFSGSFVMVSYASTVLRESGSAFDPNTSAILVGLIEIFGIYTATLLVDRAGRRTLLMVSASGAVVALALLGAYSFMNEHNVDLSNFQWIPVTCFSFYVFIVSIGIIPLPYIILTEIIPPQIRDIGSTMCMISNSVFGFITVKTFPILVANFHLYAVMWLYCSVCVLGVLFSIFILKETKGKNLNKIESK